MLTSLLGDLGERILSTAITGYHANIERVLATTANNAVDLIGWLRALSQPKPFVTPAIRHPLTSCASSLLQFLTSLPHSAFQQTLQRWFKWS